jgi:uncharacterized protein YecE (DUF72 family)
MEGLRKGVTLPLTPQSLASLPHDNLHVNLELVRMPASTRSEAAFVIHMAEVRIGISGWSYPPWRGNFYPARLFHKHELAFATRMFNALEVNGTFYSLQKPATFEAWYRTAPAGFLFALKGGRYLTHIRRLSQPRQPLANFLGSGLLCLREKLGPILWQFPPSMPFLEDRFREFFDLLPRDHHALARFAAQHSTRSADQLNLEVDVNRPVRHAVEFRHKSFLNERFVTLLQEHRIALVVADTASRYPRAEDVTADWVYVRLHGSRQLYRSGYTLREIEWWARRIRAWRNGFQPSTSRVIGHARLPRRPRDVFAFFDNTDAKRRAPVDARRLARMLQVGPRQTAQQVMRDVLAARAVGAPATEGARQVRRSGLRHRTRAPD